MKPGDTINAVIGNEAVSAQAKAVLLFERETHRDLLVVETTQGNILMRKRDGRALLTWPGRLGDQPERAAPKWGLAPSAQDAAATLFDVRDEFDRRCLKKLGWWQFVSREV